MKIGQFRIGLRTVKTALAVMFCILLFQLTNGGTISAMIASVSAVFSMRQDITSTVKFGKSRLIGNSLGGILALGYYAIQHFFHQNFFVELFVVPLLVALLIIISDGIDNNSGIIGGVAALLIIVLTIPNNESFSYAIGRIFDTFIGIFISIGVNMLIKPQKSAEIKEIDSTMQQLEQQEAELKILRQKLNEYEQDQPK